MKLNGDPSSIQGNASSEVKQTCLELFRFFISTPGNSYGADIGQRLKLVEINIWGEGGSTSAQTVVEITVEKGKFYSLRLFESSTITGVAYLDMCNVFETMHGACAAYIVDPCVTTKFGPFEHSPKRAFP